MTPSDPRHGRPAGYRAGCRQLCCQGAIARYNEARRLACLNGTWSRALRSATGVRRRLQALMALGWSAPRIAAELDTDPAWIRYLIHQSSLVSAATQAKVAAVYDRLSMRLPPSDTRGERQGSTRARNYAQAHGWLPPLAWDDIDHDPNPLPASPLHDLIDEVVVRRIVDGDAGLARDASPAERRAVVTAWASTGRSLSDLERLTGWKPERYSTPQTPAAVASTPAAAGPRPAAGPGGEASQQPATPDEEAA